MKWNDPTSLHLAPRPKKTPKQGRSVHLVAAIREACLRILDSEGVDALTTNRIAEVAGVGVSSVYQYFPNKEAILAAVYDDLLAREGAALNAPDGAAQPQASPQALQFLIQRGIDQRRRFLRLAPDFYRKYHREFQLAARFGADTPEQGLHRAMAAAGIMFEQLGEALRVPNDRVAQFLFIRGVGAIIDRAAEEEPDLLDDPDFHAALTDMVTGYLLRRERS